MLGITYLMWDLWIHPFTTLLIFTSVWIWIKILFNEWDQRYQFLTYQDCILKKQYWKFFPVTFTNNSLLTLFINLTCLWSLRKIENDLGSAYMFKNSLLLLLLDLIFSVVVIKYVSRFLPVALHHALHLTNIHSGSTIIVAWVTFQAIRFMLFPKLLETWQYFLFAGFLLLPIGLMPIFLLAYHLFFSPRVQHFPILMSVLSGFCLGFGLDIVLATNYWTFSFLFDIFIVILLSFSISDASPFNDQLFRVSTQVTSLSPDHQSEEVVLVEWLERSEPPNTPVGPVNEVEMTPLRSGSSSTILGNLRLPRLTAGHVVDANPVQLSQLRRNGEDFDEEAQPLLSAGEDGPNIGQRIEHVATAAATRANGLWRNLTSRRQRDGYSELNMADDDQDLENDQTNEGRELRRQNDDQHRQSIVPRREVIPER